MDSRIRRAPKRGTAKPLMIINPTVHLQKKYERVAEVLGFTIWQSGQKWSLTFTNPALFNGGTLPAQIRDHAANTLHRITDVFYHGETPLGELPDGQDALGLGTMESIRWHDLRALGPQKQGSIEWIWSAGAFPPGPGQTRCFWPKEWHQADWNLLPPNTPNSYRTGGHVLAFELHVPATPYRDHYRISLVKNTHVKTAQVEQIERALNAGLFCLWREAGEDTSALCKWERPGRPGVAHLSDRLASWHRVCGDLFTAANPYTPDDLIQKWLSLRINYEAVRCLIDHPHNP